MTNIICQNKKSNMYDKRVMNTLQTKRSQQKPPYSTRNSAESVCKDHTNIEDMRQKGNKFQ